MNKLFFCSSLFIVSQFIFFSCDSDKPNIRTNTEQTSEENNVDKNTNLPSQTTGTPAPIADTDPHSQYTGSASCASCHQHEYDEWLTSDHKHAMDLANEKTVLGNFDNQTITVNNVTHRFYRADNGDYMVATDNEKGEMTDYKIEYVLGWHPLQQYMVNLGNGKIQCLHTAWDAVQKKWYHLYKDNPPPAGDWLHWTGQGMTWNSQCAECHTTATNINYDRKSKSFHTNYTEMNVSCESCHGPGKSHIAHYQGDKSITDTIRKLTKDSGTTAQEEINSCVACHSRRSRLKNSIDPLDKPEDSYVISNARRGLYEDDGKILDEVFVYGSYSQSRHHRFGVRCSDCHNSHTGKTKFPDNRTCTQCHQSDQYDTPKHTFHTDPEGSKCINCHMGGKTYMGNDFRHDHSFRIPRPDLSKKYGTSNTCNDCHKDKNETWASQAIEKHFGPTRKAHYTEILLALRNNEPGSVEKALDLLANPLLTPEMGRATILSEIPATYSPATTALIQKSLKDPSHLVRLAAIEIADQLPLDQKLKLILPQIKDPARAVRQEVAFSLAAIPDAQFPKEYESARQKAETELIEALETTSDSPGGLLRYGVYLERKGDFDQAKELYNDSLEVDYLHHPARFNLATLHSRLGDNKSAEVELRTIVKQYPQLAQAHYMLGQLLAEEKRFMEAQKSFKKATELPNCPPRAFRNWGITLEHMGMHDEAIKVYQQGLKMYPGYQELDNFIQRIQFSRNQNEKFKQQQENMRKQQQQQRGIQ